MSDDVNHKLSHDTPTLRANVTPPERAGGQDSSSEAEAEAGGVVKVCKACSRPAPLEAEFCPECGAELVSIRRPPDTYLSEVVGGKYRIVEKIGQGGMGVVYLARNDELGQKVAVKFLSRKLAEDANLVLRFLNEAKSYCRVNHPNAVTLLDYGQHEDDALFIITEFVEGKNVTETLQKRGPLAAETVLDLGIQIAEVLSAAHHQGVIHRDLKPDNIMLMPLARGRYAVKVLDFGIAKIVDEEDGPNTETGSVFGTPEFMSPEQARGEDADGRSDIYALGVIMFYMVTGKLPFRGKNKLVVLNMQLNDPAPRPRDVFPETDITPRFESVIMKCLNKGREQRYDSADDLLEALEELRVPGGQATGRLGHLRESQATPLVQRSVGGQLDSDASWDEIHTHDDTLASIENKAAKWELESIELDRELDGVSDTGRKQTTESSNSNLVAVFMIVAILAVGLLVYIAFYQNRSAPPMADAARKEAMRAVDDSYRGAAAAVEGPAEGGKPDDAPAAVDDSPISDPADPALQSTLMNVGDVVGEVVDAGSTTDAAVGEEVAEPQEKPKPRPRPDSDRAPDPREGTNELPDDMSLPPKTLEDE